MLKSVLFLAAVCMLCQGREFNNPVIDGLDTPDPGVVFYKGLYYAVTTSNVNTPSKYPIHVSSDLQNWELVSYVFLEHNHPVWSTDVEYWAPEIHILGEGQFRVYFTTRELESKRLAIGAAFATDILGPYHALDRPLTIDLGQDILDSTLINDNGTLYLVWKGATWMYGREMNSDGLSFRYEDGPNLLMRDDLPWETGIIEGPWFIKRDGYFYMFYSGSMYCGDQYSVGVGRCDKPLGVYEKRGDPILVSNDEVKGPGHCSVVKDVDGVSDVMVFHGYKAGEVCGPYPRVMWAKSVAWGADGWPYMTD